MSNPIQLCVKDLTARAQLDREEATFQSAAAGGNGNMNGRLDPAREYDDVPLHSIIAWGAQLVTLDLCGPDWSQAWACGVIQVRLTE